MSRALSVALGRSALRCSSSGTEDSGPEHTIRHSRHSRPWPEGGGIQGGCASEPPEWDVDARAPSDTAGHRRRDPLPRIGRCALAPARSLPPAPAIAVYGSVTARSSSEWLSLWGANFRLRIPFPIVEGILRSMLWDVRCSGMRVTAISKLSTSVAPREMIPTREALRSQNGPQVLRSPERAYGR